MLTSTGNQGIKKILVRYLETVYGGTVRMTYKGREALSMGMKLLGLPGGSGVVINGYTCFAVYSAVIAAGLRPVFLDIDRNLLHFTPESLDRLLRKDNTIKSVVVQNTFGIPCDIAGIRRICDDHNLRLVEDMAHSAGIRYPDGRRAGTVGDIAALSFSQDKLLDGVSGGALITHVPGLKKHNLLSAGVPFWWQLKDRFYPLLTLLIRSTYPTAGKAFHEICRRFGLLATPMGGTDQVIIRDLPDWYCRQITGQFRQLDNSISHRRAISRIYAQTLVSRVLVSGFVRSIENSACIRFPVLVPDRNGLIAHCRKYGIYIGDIWYDAPVAPVKYLRRTGYHGECPVGQAVSERMVNLPTHRGIDTDRARQIAERINSWLKS